MKYQKHLLVITLCIISFNCSGPITHQVTSSFEDGSVKTISIFKGSSIIQEINFSNDGNIITRSFFRNNCLFGRWTSGDFFEDKELVSNYYGNGVLKSEGYIVNNSLHGHWSHYDRYGKLESDRYYFYGEPIGDWYSYYNGNIDVKHYSYFKGNGNWVEYYNADENIVNNNKLKIKESSFFHNAKLSGLYEYYYKNGSLKVSGYYADGKKNGEWTHYDENGNLIKIENYLEGSLDGDFKLFFNDGVTEKLIGKYKNNKRVETWFWFFDIDKKSNHKIDYSLK